jgi:hypothetical protein
MMDEEHSLVLGRLPLLYPALEASHFTSVEIYQAPWLVLFPAEPLLPGREHSWEPLGKAGYGIHSLCHFGGLVGESRETWLEPLGADFCKDSVPS